MRQLRPVSTLLTLLLMLLHSNVEAGKLTRAWKAYTDGDFKECRELCEKVITKDSLNTFANYLIGLTSDQMAQSQNELYEGLDHTDRAARGYGLASISDRDELSEEFGFSSESISNLKEKLGNRILDLLEKEPDIEAYNRFIGRIGIPTLAESAIRDRNRFAFELADKQGTIESYTQFINTYPLAPDVDLAKRKINHLRYLAAKGNIDALLHFVRSNPEAEDIGTAEKELVDLFIEKTKRTGQPAHLETLRKQAPELAGLPQVKTRIYQTHFDLLSDNGSLEDWISFTELYERSWVDRRVIEKLKSILDSDSITAEQLKSINGWLDRYSEEGFELKELLIQKRMKGRDIYPYLQCSDMKWGICDQTGELLIEPIFKLAYPPSNGLALVQTQDGLFHYLNKNLKKTGNSYRHALPFKNGMGLAWCKKNSSGLFEEEVILLDELGNETILGISDETSCLADRMLQPLVLDSIGKTSTGKMAYIISAGTKTWIVYDDLSFKEMDVTLPAGFEGKILPYSSGGVFPYHSYNNLFGLIDYKGKIVLQPLYDEIAPAGLPRAFAVNTGGHRFDYEHDCDVEGGSWKLVRNSGVELVKTPYEYIGYFDNGPAPYTKNGRWGYMDELGKPITQAVYDQASPFINQVAEVGMGGRKFPINKQGQEIKEEYYSPNKAMKVFANDADLIEHNTTKIRKELAIAVQPGDDQAAQPMKNRMNAGEKTVQYNDEDPLFPGGEPALDDYVKRNIRYPSAAREKQVSGKVYCSLVVGKDGTVSQVKVIRGIGSGCDEEAIRLIQQMPKWLAGKLNGKPVNTQISLPIQFK